MDAEFRVVSSLPSAASEPPASVPLLHARRAGVGAWCLGLLAWLSATSAPASEMARTPSGRPDLSGNYDISTLTPWERPTELGDKRAYTPEEAQAIIRSHAEGQAALDAPSDPNRTAPPVGGNVGAYNNFFFERGSAPAQVNGEYRTSVIVEPPDGRFPPLTAQGRARREGKYSFMSKNSGEAWWLGEEIGPFDGPESLSIADRCIYHFEATLPARPRVYNNIKTIVQTEDAVMILSEWMHEPRIVRLGGTHAPSEIRDHAGDSIGWWEGDTLVVETTNFLEQDWVTTTVGNNVSATADQRIVERFSPSGAGDLLYQFEVSSSDYETPYRGEYTWPRTSNKLYEYACHEGNYAMGNILRGARLLESEARE